MTLKQEFIMKRNKTFFKDVGFYRLWHGMISIDCSMKESNSALACFKKLQEADLLVQFELN